MKAFDLWSVTNKKEPGLWESLPNFRNCLNREFVPFLKTETSNCSYQELIIRDTKLAPHPDSALLRKSIFFYINAIANELYPKRVYSIVFYQQPLVGLGYGDGIIQATGQDYTIAVSQANKRLLVKD